MGVGVFSCPAAEVAASSRVFAVSWDEQLEPFTRTSPRHSERIEGVPSRTVPVKSTPAGRRIVWSARSMTSKPLSPPDLCVKSDTLTWDCPSPVIEAETGGHAVLPDGIMQTNPATVTMRLAE